jgi:hypothetical protein
MHHLKIIIIDFILILFFLLNIYDEIRIFYLPFNIPGKQMAATIPPFGVFIEAQFIKEPNTRCSILNHEKVHWKQFRRMGLTSFYMNYLKVYFESGRIKNWMENEAKLPCKTGKMDNK